MVQMQQLSQFQPLDAKILNEKESNKETLVRANNSTQLTALS